MRREILERLASGRGGVEFATTHWSLILEAGDPRASGAAEALEVLCAAYWTPLYAFTRRLGYSRETAEDLVQGCFERLLRSPGWLEVSPERGRFRSWLLAALKHHLADERQRSATRRRGAGVVPIPLEALDLEDQRQGTDASDRSPEKEFDRRWSLALLAHVLGRLMDDSARAGRERLFAELKGFLPGGSDARRLAEVADSLGMSEGALKVALHRLRARYREILLEEVGRVVADPAEVRDELRHLVAVLSEA